MYSKLYISRLSNLKSIDIGYCVGQEAVNMVFESTTLISFSI